MFKRPVQPGPIAKRVIMGREGITAIFEAAIGLRDDIVLVFKRGQPGWFFLNGWLRRSW